MARRQQQFKEEEEEKEEQTFSLSSKFKPSIYPYSKKDQNNLTRKLRNLTQGYNNAQDFSIKKIMSQRKECLQEYKENNYKNDPQTEKQLKLLDPIYRLLYTNDEKLRKQFNEIKKLIQNMGIRLPEQMLNEQDPEQSQYWIIQQIYKAFLISEKNPDGDDNYEIFKNEVVSVLKGRFRELNLEDQYFGNLQRNFYDIKERKNIILNTPILDDTDKSLQNIRFEFGTEGHSKILMQKYEDSFKYNQRENVVKFQFAYGDEQHQDGQESQEVKKVFFGEKNYVKEFYDLFKDLLVQKSPEFWQFLVYDILRVVCDKKVSNRELELKLMTMLDEKVEPVQYLTSFRKEMVKYLHKANFGKKDAELEAMQQNSVMYKDGNQNQVMNNYQVLKVMQMDERQVDESMKEAMKGQKKGDVGVRYDHEQDRLIKTGKSSNKDGYKMDEQFNDLDFVKMEQNQLVKHIPTLLKIEHPEYLMFRIDPIPRLKVQEHELVYINKLPTFAQIAFEGIQKLNIIQSTSFKVSFETDDNILVSAPTGAGKTNIALLAILREISKHIDENNKVTNADFKIVYLSPMKALAAEITEKFQQRLGPLGIKVKECSGDMQLTKTEMEETQIIITTPEKWDVITRKTNQVADQLQLLLIDEIHLLNDERGSVLECLIARTLQHIERNQKSVRLFGISATMPNYLDVAALLHVRKNNVFFFDHRYRPVPLLQKFIGVKEPKGIKKNARGQKKNKKDIYDEFMYEAALGVLKHNKQVLVFVHSRKETTVTAKYFSDQARIQGHERLIKPQGNIPIPKLQDKLLQQLVPLGVGYHHAGMLRKDRNLVEKMFLEGTIRVLCATSTLAWGVNLPAFQVIIKGTDVYDPSKGGVQNLSVLDVQQMFGRAGRPQYDDQGEAILMTDFAQVGHYMGQLNNASFLESKLSQMLGEAVNAEIVLGNVTTSKEAFDWINHTFFSIRIRRNPIQYGCRVMDKANKELLVEIHISELIEDCLKRLDALRLIRYDRNSGYLSSTDLGRICSHYYVKTTTMEIFCKAFGLTVEEGDDTIEDFKQKKNDYKSDLDILKILAQAKEFDQIKYRQEELGELKDIFKNHWALDEHLDLLVAQNPGSHAKNLMTEPIIETPEKIIALISGYLFRLQRYENFSLVSDTQFIIQNASRLLRAMLEMTMQKNMAFNVEVIQRWCKLIETRLVPGESPLRQFCRENFQGFNAMKNRKENREGFLNRDVVEIIERKDLYIDRIKEMSAEELGHVLHYKKGIAQVVKKFAACLPEVQVDYKIKPVAQTVLQMDVQVTPNWTYSGRWHSKNEVFWIIVDNEEEILYKDSFAISAKQQHYRTPIDINFFLPFRDSKATYYRMSITSNSWIVDPEYQVQIDLGEIYIKGEKMDFTELLDLQPLPITIFRNPKFSSIYKIKYLNANQSQVFHALYHTNENVLIGSPTGSGKTMMCEFSVLRVFQNYPGTKVVYVAPMKAIAKERVQDWDAKFRPLGKDVLELTGDFTPDLASLMKADVLITTPEKWDGISRNWNNRAYTQQISLLIFDEIHLLGQDRGPVIEVIVSRMNLIASRTGKKCRMVGLSTAMANGTDVAEWFGVPKFFFFNFRPHIRPVPISIYFDGFSEKAYCPRMGTMNKPAFNAIKKFSNEKPVLIFVSSRRQTRLTALDLIAFTMQETGGESSRYVKCPPEELDVYISQVQDEYLIQTLTFGIGMHHGGLSQNDRSIVETLYLGQKIQVLVATSTLAWGVNLPARLVIVKGTEYFDPQQKRYVDMPVTDILQMIGRAGRPQFDDVGIACVYVEQSKKNFYRQYLNDPFPIESSLIGQLHDHFNAEISNSTIQNKQQCIDWLTWTYFFRRLLKNPSYYGLENIEPQDVKKFLISLVDKSLNILKEHKCITIDEEDGFKIEPTFLGNLGSFYYIKHESMSYFDEKINNEISIPDLIRVISYAQEYAGVPMRHNEENLNEELSKICPLKCNKKAMDSCHEKTYMLFQAHIFRLPLPIRDYLTDTKTVIDASIRIIHCLIDLAAEKQYLQTVLNLMLLMQMLVQGVWFDKCALINLPYLEGQNLEKLGLLYLCELVELQSKGKLEKALTKVPELAKNKKKIQQITDMVNTIPNIRMRTAMISFDQEQENQVKQEESDGSSLGKEIPIEQGGEAFVKVELFRENHQQPLRVQLQAVSKIKDASWWLVVGNEHDDKLLGIKKVYFKKTVNKKIQVELPENFAKCPNLKVFLVSDSYIGIDQVMNLPLKIEGKTKKSKKDVYI